MRGEKPAGIRAQWHEQQRELEARLMNQTRVIPGARPKQYPIKQHEDQKSNYDCRNNTDGQ
ncbi:hypothetical protein KY332_01460 [Candidatus Woesearchaeota archaeon]|nr:hypothetical protein [Candidatus Woesearchaeota archaeon]